MKKSTKSIMAGLALAAIAIPGTVAAEDIDAFAAAELETEQQNMAWYTDLDTDATQNETCREDLPEPVYVPEYDTDVLVKAEVIAVGNITCFDIELESDAPIEGWLNLEARFGWNDWQEAHNAPIRDDMVAGFGRDEAAFRYVVQPDDPIRGLPLRVCIKTETPDESFKFCKTVKSAVAAAIRPPA